MGSLIGFAATGSSSLLRLPLASPSKAKKNDFLKAQLRAGDDPLFQAAVTAATVRYRESLRPEPLFVDSYAGCLVSPEDMMDSEHNMFNYCLATKYIDDKLLSTLNQVNGLKQVVLLTDGMDTRPYRLRWPSSTLIFDISPEKVFRIAAEKLEAVGAKVPRGCLFHHIPLASSDVGQILRAKGFNGNRSSIWVFQGLPMMTVASFQEILFSVSSLAMKGCLMIGELPTWVAKTEIGNKSSTKRWADKIFLSSGFHVNVIGYNEVAKGISQQPGSEDYKYILFVAEHLRYSDDQHAATGDAYSVTFFNKSSLTGVMCFFVSSLDRWKFGGKNFKGWKKKGMKKGLRSCKSKLI